MDVNSILLFHVPAFIAVGVALFLGDLKWGVPVRKGFIDLASAEPQNVTQGFLAGRPRRVWFAWAFAVACFVNLPLLLIRGAMAALTMPLYVAIETVACFAGLNLGPAFNCGLRAIGLGLDRMDQLEARIKESGPGLIEAAVSRGQEVKEAVQEAAAQVIDKVTPGEPAPPSPTDEEERQAKIDRMDEMLGRKKRTREGGGD